MDATSNTANTATPPPSLNTDQQQADQPKNYVGASNSNNPSLENNDKNLFDRSTETSTPNPQINTTDASQALASTTNNRYITAEKLLAIIVEADQQKFDGLKPHRAFESYIEQDDIAALANILERVLAHKPDDIKLNIIISRESYSKILSRITRFSYTESSSDITLAKRYEIIKELPEKIISKLKNIITSVIDNHPLMLAESDDADFIEDSNEIKFTLYPGEMPYAVELIKQFITSDEIDSLLGNEKYFHLIFNQLKILLTFSSDKYDLAELFKKNNNINDEQRSKISIKLNHLIKQLIALHNEKTAKLAEQAKENYKIKIKEIDDILQIFQIPFELLNEDLSNRLEKDSNLLNNFYGNIKKAIDSQYNTDTQSAIVNIILDYHKPESNTNDLAASNQNLDNTNILEIANYLNLLLDKDEQNLNIDPEVRKYDQVKQSDLADILYLTLNNTTEQNILSFISKNVYPKILAILKNQSGCANAELENIFNILISASEQDKEKIKKDILIEINKDQQNNLLLNNPVFVNDADSEFELSSTDSYSITNLVKNFIPDGYTADRINDLLQDQLFIIDAIKIIKTEIKPDAKLLLDLIISAEKITEDKKKIIKQSIQNKLHENRQLN